MVGFLPAWLAVIGVALASFRVVVTLAEPTRVPVWLIPLAALLALGTYR